MSRTEYKTVTVKQDTFVRLLRRKKYPKESFDETINRILDGDIRDQRPK